MAVLGFHPHRQQGAPRQHPVIANNLCLIFRRMSSRDAYMLVYMRRGVAPGGPVEVQQPPQRALDVVLQMNQRHADACATFAKRSIFGVPLIGDANRMA